MNKYDQPKDKIENKEDNKGDKNSKLNSKYPDMSKLVDKIKNISKK